MAVLAAMERTAPAVSAASAWTPARLFRWAAPLAAAATAVAIWVAVPDRPITPVEPAPARASAAPEPGTPNQHPAPSTQNLEPRRPVQSAPSARLDKPAVDEQLQMRDELRRERAAPEAFGATAAAPRAAAPSAPPPPAASTDTLAETAAATAQRSAFNSTAVSSESVAPSNPLVRWRVVGWMSVERSTDGGKTWARTTPPPGVAPNNTIAVTVVILRAVDADRAVVRTSDSTEFYTTNGGLSWVRVQENSAAPF